MKKLLFVFNPNSGKGLIKNHLMKIVQVLSEADYEVVVYPTKCAGDGYEKVLKVGKKYDVVVCSGGDGTLNEVVGAILKLEKKPKVGYIPSGSTNDFAASLNISKNMVKAAKSIAEGNVYPVDIYPSVDFNTGRPILVYIFEKEKTRDLYEQWKDRRNQEE